MAIARPSPTNSTLRLALSVLILLGEAAWISAWSIFIGSWFKPDSFALLAVPAVLGLLAAASILAWAANDLAHLGQVGATAVALIGLVVALAPVIAGFDFTSLGSVSHVITSKIDIHALAQGVLIFITWWRGIRVTQTRPSVEGALSRFRGDTVGFVLLLLLSLGLLKVHSLDIASFAGSAVVLLFTSLTSLPLIRVYRENAHRPTEGPQLGVNSQWLTMLLGIVSGILLLAILLSGTLSGQLRGVLGFLEGPLNLLFEFGGWLVALGLAFLRSWIHPRPPHQVNGPLTTPTTLAQANLQQRASERNAGQDLQFLDWILAIGLLLIFAWIAIYLIRRAMPRLVRRRPVVEVEEERRWIWSWSDVLSELHELALWFFRRRKASTVASTGSTSDLSQTRTRLLNIRAVYTEMLAIGARLSRRRAQPETPNEYAKALSRSAAARPGEKQIGDITALYNNARYGDYPSDQQQLDEALTALRELEEIERTRWDNEQ